MPTRGLTARGSLLPATLGTPWGLEMPLSSVTADHALHLDQAIVQIYGPFTVQTYPVSASEEFQTKMQRSLGLSLIIAQWLRAPRVQWVIPGPEFAP